MAEGFSPSDVVGNVFGGGTSGGDVGIILGLMALALFILIAVGLGIGYLMWYSKFRHKVVVFEVYSGGVRFSYDKAKLLKNKGISKLELFKARTKLQLPPNYNSKYWYGKNQAYIVHKENEMYRFHIEYNVNRNELQVLPQEVTEFIVKDIEENHKNYGVKEFWEEWGQTITSFGFSIMVFGMMLILINEFSDITGQINGIMSKANEILQQTMGGSPP
jgi:hypothetical protein